MTVVSTTNNDKHWFTLPFPFSCKTYFWKMLRTVWNIITSVNNNKNTKKKLKLKNNNRIPTSCRTGEGVVARSTPSTQLPRTRKTLSLSSVVSRMSSLKGRLMAAWLFDDAVPIPVLSQCCITLVLWYHILKECVANKVFSSSRINFFQTFNRKTI